MAFFSLIYLKFPSFSSYPLENNNIVEPPSQKRFVCLIDSTTMSKFRSKLEGVDWSSVYSINSVNESYDTFSSDASEILPVQPIIITEGL